MASIYDIERRAGSAWINRAITHLSMPPDRPMDDDTLQAVSILLAAREALER